MALSVQCSCGKQLSAPEQMAGQAAKCPACGNLLRIPDRAAAAPSRRKPPAARQGNVPPVSHTAAPVIATSAAAKSSAVETSNRAGGPPPPTTTLATWSLVLGVLSLFCAAFTGIPAVVCGFLGLNKIAKRPAAVGGRTLAITGMVLGGIGTLLTVMYAMIAIPIIGLGTAISLPAVEKAREAANRTVAMHNMKHLTVATISYHRQHGKWPQSVDELSPWLKDNGGLRKTMTNPLTGDEPGFEYVRPGATADSTTIVFYQLRAGKRDLSLPVAYLDGSVRDYQKSKTRTVASRPMQPTSSRPGGANGMQDDRRPNKSKNERPKPPIGRPGPPHETLPTVRTNPEPEPEPEPEPPPRHKLDVALDELASDDPWAGYHAMSKFLETPREEFSPERTAKAIELLQEKLNATEQSAQVSRFAATYAYLAGPEQVEQLKMYARQTENQRKGIWGPAIAALIRLSPDDARRILQDRYEEFGFRTSVSADLRKLPAEYAVELTPLLSGTDVRIRAEMITILGEIGTSDVLPAIEKAYRQADEREQRELRSHVERAVEAIRKRNA